MPLTPSGEIVRVLKDGYWDITAVVRMPDGSQRVRKQSKPLNADQIWGLESLRREITYLKNQPDTPARVFPPLLDAWDQPKADGSPHVGYEIPFLAHHRDMGSLASETIPKQSEVDEFQSRLADALLHHVHIPAKVPSPLSVHLIEAVTDALTGLGHDPLFAQLLEADQITLNGKPMCGPRAAWEKITTDSGLLNSLDEVPAVQLHGDFFLENILWTDASPSDGTPRLVLIDPVSVAGVIAGPAVFDLVKYESYAKGELPALRSEWVNVSGFNPDTPGADYQYTINWDEVGLRSYRQRNWCSILQQKFVDHHGPINRQHYQLIDGYFSVAMALNTSGKQRQARLLKAVVEFNEALNHPSSISS